MKLENLSKKMFAVIFLFSNISFNSLAGTLPEDDRYESFEGDNIVVSDIIENNKVDVEIEGSTLVNILSYKDLNINSYWTYKDGAGYMQLTDKVDTFKSIYHPLNS